jgi:hypothetical protein
MMMLTLCCSKFARGLLADDIFLFPRNWELEFAPFQRNPLVQCHLPSEAEL